MLKDEEEGEWEKDCGEKGEEKEREERKMPFCPNIVLELISRDCDGRKPFFGYKYILRYYVL